MSIAAVGSVLSSISSISRAGSEPAPSALGDFASLLESIGKDTVKTFETAEVKSLSALSGKGSAREVVDAVMSAERTLQVAVGIRDKIVSAYLELSRMAI